MGIIISLFPLHQPSSLLLPFGLLYLFYKFLCRFRQACKFSGHSPPTYPLIGCFLSFYKNRSRLLDWYTELLSESATGTIVIHRLGALRTVVTANPVNVEYILTTHFTNFPKGKPFTEILGDFLGCGIFNVDGELWRTQRKLASHEFSGKSLREFVVKTLELEVEKRLLPGIESSARDMAVVDLQELLRGFAFGVICKVVLGSEEEPISQQLESSFDVASEVSAGRATEPLYFVWKMKRWFRVGSERRLKIAVEQVHSNVMKIIENRRKKKKKIQDLRDSEDLLSRLISGGHQDEVIRDMAISFIMAGRDTTSAAMTWLFRLLYHHPDIHAQLLEEIDSQSPGKFHYRFLEELRFLKACLCETMRLYPPVPWDSKHAIVNDRLPDGTLVRAGDRVTYFPYGMGRMEALWGKDWFEFKPSRWLLETDDGGGRRRPGEKRVSPYKFPIFQAGPRVCLGKEMAFIQMKFVVASILTRFKIIPVCTDNPVFVPLLTAHMAGGFRVLFQKRETELKTQTNPHYSNSSHQKKIPVNDSNTADTHQC